LIWGRRVKILYSLLRSYKYRLYPNKEQGILLAKHFGACRWVYNDALALRAKLWQEKKESISWADLSARLPILKIKEETQWLKEVNAQSLVGQIINLEKAYQAFFKKGGGFPTFKKRHGRQSFQCPQAVKIDLDAKTIQLPKFTSMRFAFSRPFEGKVKTVTISRDPSGKHFAAVLVETGKDALATRPYSDVLGIDLGLSHFATFSDGKKIENPRLLKSSLTKLAREQRRLSRKVKGSKNRAKQRVRVALAHEKIRNQRTDFLHKLSTGIIRENQAIALEDLNVVGMQQNRSLARSVSDASWSEFVRQLEYKASWHGKTVLRIGRFDPSSKLCTCGVINRTLSLSDRVWTCPSCGTTHDRDVLAANNIKSFALGRVTADFKPVESPRRKAPQRSRKTVA
jgi:putative transposase